jgi:hypothetical protein
MGRFRSLFDADEMRDLAVAAGIVGEAAATPETEEPVVRRSLLLDDDAQEVPDPSPNPGSRTGAALLFGGPPAQAYGASAVTSAPQAQPEPRRQSGETLSVAESMPSTAAPVSPGVSATVGNSFNQGPFTPAEGQTESLSPEPGTESPQPSADAGTRVSGEHQADGTPDETDERVRRLLMQYLAGESAPEEADANDRSEVVDTPLPAIVMDDDEVPLDAPHQALWHETSSLGSDASTRAFLATPSAELKVASDSMDTSSVAASDGPFADSLHVRSELPWGAAAGGVAGGVENASDAQAPELASESGSTVWDTPFEEGHSRTVVSAVTDPAPLPGQELLTKLSRPPLFTLLRASLIARVPWRVWQREPWAQPNLCAALAEVTGESEQLFEQEDAWRN